MKDYVEERVREVGEYILSTGSTIRKTAKKFGVCKTTIHKDVERLNELNPLMAEEVNAVLQNHFAIKHIHGGLATKQKYDIMNKFKMGN